jgi:choline-sulfatase
VALAEDDRGSDVPLRKIVVTVWQTVGHQTEMRNVLLVTVDCLRYDRCGFNGHHRNTTPTLDALAADALVFDRCYSTGPYTTESVPGILAAQHSHNGSKYGDNAGYKAIASDSQTLARGLSEQGWTTAAVISNPHLTSDRNFHLGFDSFENRRSTSGDDHDDDGGSDFGSMKYAFRNWMRKSQWRYNPLLFFFTAFRLRQMRSGWPTTDAQSLTDRSIEVLSEITEQDSPFFLWTHFMDLHAPIHPKRAADAGLSEIPTVRSILWDARRAGGVHEPRYDLLYDSALRYVDGQLSRLLNHLDRFGELSETVVVVTSDHGEVLFDREGVYGHPPHYHYDELLHVSLLVHNSEHPAARIDSPLSLAWMHELLDEVSGFESEGFPSSSESESLLTAAERAFVVSDTLDETGHTVSVRDQNRKSIVHRGDGSIDWAYADEPESFSYDLDRHERVPEAECAESLLRHGRSLLRPHTELSEVEGRFDPSTVNRLRDLGYLS